MHKFKQLVNYSLQELPVCSKEPGVLPNDIHDVGRNNSLIVLAFLLFAKAQQVFNNSHQEPLLIFLMHGSWYATNGPAKLFTESLYYFIIKHIDILFSKHSNTTPK